MVAMASQPIHEHVFEDDVGVFAFAQSERFVHEVLPYSAMSGGAGICEMRSSR